MKFLFPEVALCLYKSTIWLCMEYCYHVWADNFSFRLPLLKLKHIMEVQPASVFSIGITLLGIDANQLNWFHFLILEGSLLVILIDCPIFLSPFLDITRMPISTVSFLAQLDSGILQPLKFQSKCISKFIGEANPELSKLPCHCCGNCFANTFGKFCLDSHGNLGISFFFLKEKSLSLYPSINLFGVVDHCMHQF